MNTTEIPDARTNLSAFNVTGPPENFRFIPGLVPTSYNITGVSSRRDKLFNATGYYIDDEGEPGNFKMILTEWICAGKIERNSRQRRFCKVGRNIRCWKVFFFHLVKREMINS